MFPGPDGSAARQSAEQVVAMRGADEWLALLGCRRDVPSLVRLIEDGISVIPLD